MLRRLPTNWKTRRERERWPPLNGDTMDRINSRIAQVYGYAVCFITVIVMLISIKQVVDSLIDLTDPIRAEGGGYGRMGRPLTNFEVYKMSARREPSPRGASPVQGTTVPNQSALTSR